MSRRRSRKGRAASGSPEPGRLRSKAWVRFLRGPDPDLVEKLYVPALSEALRYDRCCSYFSSSVLAAAARGFSGLIRRLICLGDSAPRPAVRLVVNEELSAEDVRALVETGDTSRLEEVLRKRLRSPKELLEKHRLGMLGWLAKERLLEVRVGVMRQGGGIVHAKFGVMTDEAGDAVVFSGSGNESASGLRANYERLEVSTSWEDMARYEEYSQEFGQLWTDEHTEVHTVTLPEALRLQLIKFAPKEPPVEEPSTGVERQRKAMLWHFLTEAPYLANGEGYCDGTAMVELWPHQRHVVEETTRAWPSGRLLCDEVGLGKTIEAVFILRRLLAGRGVRRVLVLPPANLVTQWQEELREKGGLVFPVFDNRLVWPDGTTERVEGLAGALARDTLILSRETARREDNRRVLLEAAPWDLALLDEAHAARRQEQEEGEFNSANLLLELLRQLQLRGQVRGLLLLSATPMQTHPWEPWDLLSVLGVGGTWLADFSGVRGYYGAVAALARGQCDLSGARQAATLIASDPEFPPVPTAMGAAGAKAVTDVLAYALPSQRAALVAWLREGSPLGRRMHRNTRNTLKEYYGKGILDKSPPERVVDDQVFDFATAAERDAYEAVTDYIEARYQALEEQKGGKGFVMTVYRRRASSSPLALRRSLERRREGLRRVVGNRAESGDLDEADTPEAMDPEELPEDEAGGKVSAAFPDDPKAAEEELEEVDRLLAQVEGLSETDSKRDRFYEVLRNLSDDGRTVLVFTCYRDTLDYLRESLVVNYGESLGCYSGEGGKLWDGSQWHGVSKGTITQALHEGQLKLLVCTDAASEGLNLQAAGAVVNYDLPWNPSRVEQRIGRIDRIGQRYPTVNVVNLFLKDSVDERVYVVLRERCGLFKHFVGPMQPVLARAKRMLMGQEAPDLGVLELVAEDLDREPLFAETYVESPAMDTAPAAARCSPDDLASALTALDGECGLRVKQTKEGLIGVAGLERKRILFAPDVSLLEAHPGARPLSLGGECLRRMADRLSRAGERLPLVVEAREQGAFRAAVACWVEGGKVRPVESLQDLRPLVESWGGGQLAPAAWQKAVHRARREASARVQAMAEEAEARERAALDAQVSAARLRLMRELGRLLVALGAAPDGLTHALHARMVEDNPTAQRLRRCFDRLGGSYPEWPEDLQKELGDFSASLSTNDRLARQTGTEVDAALADPRWQAAPTSKRPRVMTPATAS